MPNSRKAKGKRSSPSSAEPDAESSTVDAQQSAPSSSAEAVGAAEPMDTSATGVVAEVAAFAVTSENQLVEASAVAAMHHYNEQNASESGSMSVDVSPVADGSHTTFVSPTGVDAATDAPTSRSGSTGARNSDAECTAWDHAQGVLD